MRRRIISYFVVTVAVVLLVVFALMQMQGNPSPDLMSFDEAIDAVGLGNYNIQQISYGMTGELEQAEFVDETGITGFLVWLAPNGTFYQVEYPSERVLSEIAGAYGSEYNPPDGYTFWWLDYGEGESYWVDTSDGSIIGSTPRRAR